MNRGGLIDRRGLILTAGAATVGGCASGLGAPAIQVNISGTAPPDSPEADAQLDTGFDKSQRITAPVRINGEGPFDFVVDTGANRSVISAELAAQLQLPLGEPTQIHGVAGVQPAPTALVRQLQADAITARDLRTPALARNLLGCDGLLGVDVLRNRRVLIDFTQQRLTVSTASNVSSEPSGLDLRQENTGAQRDLGKRVVVPAHYRFGQLILVGADVSGRTITAFLDTGSQSTVGNGALYRRVFESGAHPDALRYKVPIYSVTGQTADGVLSIMPLLRIGGLNITGLRTVFADLHVFEIWELTKRPSLMLGMDILGRFRAIEINYARREVAFYLPPGSRPA